MSSHWLGTLYHKMNFFLPRKIFPSPLNRRTSLSWMSLLTLPIQPLAEKSTLPTQAEAPRASMSFTEAVKGREPLGLLETNENPSAKKWYLYASAKRGIHGPSDAVDIISAEGEKGPPSPRATEIKNLLLGMGLKPNQIRVIHVKGDESQAGKVYLFGKK